MVLWTVITVLLRFFFLFAFVYAPFWYRFQKRLRGAEGEDRLFFIVFDFFV